jgi:adenylate kinase family enzyme
MDNSFYYKYLKYKNKYLELKNNIEQTGGSNNKNIIIHISGPSGAGKTTLGNKLKEKFGNKIIVKDIDVLRREFIENEYVGYKNKFTWIPEKYQKYIDNYVNKQKKPIVFVGLNHMPWWNKNLYYNMHSDYNFYIKLNDNEIFNQKCSRFMNDVFVLNKDNIIKDIIKNEEKTINKLKKGLQYECGYNEIVKMNKKWNNDYKKQKYKFMSRDDIFKEVSKILKNI